MFIHTDEGCTICAGGTFAASIFTRELYKSIQVHEEAQSEISSFHSNNLKETHRVAPYQFWTFHFKKETKALNLMQKVHKYREKYDFCDKSVFTFRHNLIPYTAGRTKCLLYCSGQLQLVSHCHLYQFWKKFLKGIVQLVYSPPPNKEINW